MMLGQRLENHRWSHEVGADALEGKVVKTVVTNQTTEALCETGELFGLRRAVVEIPVMNKCLRRKRVG